jgi:hypothetical protein
MSPFARLNTQLFIEHFIEINFNFKNYFNLETNSQILTPLTLPSTNLSMRVMAGRSLWMPEGGAYFLLLFERGCNEQNLKIIETGLARHRPKPPPRG